MSYNFNTAIIECSSSNGDVFPSSRKGDVLFYPLNNDQSILIGSSNVDAGFKMKMNKIGINTGENALLSDFQVGCKSLFEREITARDATIVIQKRGGSTAGGGTEGGGSGGLIEGTVMQHPEHHGAFFNTVADEKKLTKIKENYSSLEALDKVLKIPVHILQENESSREGSLGCLAQEILPIFPECVIGVGAKVNSPLYNNKMIDYSKIVPLLIKSIQELERRLP